MIQKGRPLSLHMPESATHIQKAKVYFFLISDSKPIAIARSSSNKVNQPEPTEPTPISVAYSDD